MAGGLTRREPAGETDLFSRFDQMFEEWAKAGPWRTLPFPRLWDADDWMIRVEEFHQDGSLVVRAELPGIDPGKDVELTVSDGMLHIRADRREEEKQEEKGYLRRELRYGSLSRSLPLPEGATDSDIKASYDAGILEVTIPEPKREPAKKIPISKP